MLPLGVQGEVHAPSGPARSEGLDPSIPLRRYASFCPFLGPSERRRALIASSGNIVSLDLVPRLALDSGIALAHLHTQNRIGGAARTAMMLTGRPYVVSIHGPLLAQPELVAADTARRTGGLRDIGQPFGLLFGARRVLDDAARVICFNDDEHRALEARIGARRAVRMDHGVDAERLASGDAARADARFPELGSAPLVTLVGRVCAQKNQLLAVRAFAAGAPRDHHLVFAGAETDPGYRATVLAEARALGVAERVHFLGNLDRERGVPDLLARSSVVLVPSTHEAFGLAVLEGWASARPVLFAASSGLKDLGRAAGEGVPMIDASDVGAWAGALRRYLTEPELRAAEADRGRRLVRDRFSWDTVVAKLADLYEEVIAASPRASRAGRSRPASSSFSAHP
jgi:glycosyltransferase involved in cell wall biosynthesis